MPGPPLTDILDGSSNPSVSEWKSYIANGIRVPAESSTVENYGGDIWLRKTPFVLPE